MSLLILREIVDPPADLIAYLTSDTQKPEWRAFQMEVGEKRRWFVINDKPRDPDITLEVMDCQGGFAVVDDDWEVRGWWDKGVSLGAVEKAVKGAVTRLAVEVELPS